MYTSTILALQGTRPPKIAEEVRLTWWPALSSGWRFWPFVHTVSFSPYVPAELKLLFIDTMEIVWVTILASVVNRKDEEKVPQVSCTIEPGIEASVPYATIEMAKEGLHQPTAISPDGEESNILLSTIDVDELQSMKLAADLRWEEEEEDGTDRDRVDAVGDASSWDDDEDATEVDAAGDASSWDDDEDAMAERSMVQSVGERRE
eukprot:CAMPEP_0177603524 /NCGR_PEP_ID=MMETSP0419_2-20121207/15563_1 /TAXON_ID=582737 /ORGANISM="Tetraselmis sp., Strain GSL018" /LENGTH=204 /DNA_ID=CAMNT_0019097311 /DNA_START=477 /DNA_END=1092 /DNA_ORIENTATION=+